MAMAVAFAFLHDILMSLPLASTEPVGKHPKVSGQSADILKGNIYISTHLLIYYIHPRNYLGNVSLLMDEALID